MVSIDDFDKEVLAGIGNWVCWLSIFVSKTRPYFNGLKYEMFWLFGGTVGGETGSVNDPVQCEAIANT